MTTLGNMTRTPGRKVTRRLEVPLHLPLPRREPGVTATALADAHNQAVREYGSNSGGLHAFDVRKRESAGVWSGGPFPDESVVSRLSWGRIDAVLAQRLLQCDGWGEEG